MKIASAPSYTPRDEIPRDLDAQLQDLERWAKGSEVDARRQTIAFWILKAPAIFGTACAGLFGHYGWETASLYVAAVSSLCILIDGLNPRGLLRSTYLRALHDIRNLTNRMMTQWRSRPEHEGAVAIARQIVRDSEEERNRIATYVRDAEAALTESKTKV